MSNFRENSAKELKEMENWLTSLFLDPLTSYLDETTFHIDIFETEEDYIVEAILTDYHPKEITVYLNGKKVYIYANGKKETEKKNRMIEFPFLLIHKNVSASFTEGILEVFISKRTYRNGKNRQILFQ